MRRSVRIGLCASAWAGVLAFWSGLWLAARKYPSEYDWRYMTISSLVYPDRNPEGYRWAWRGLMLCALGGLGWTAVLLRDWRHDSDGRKAIGIWALGVGYLCMVSCAWLPARFPRLPRAHDLLALVSFFALCIGIVVLTFQLTEVPRASTRTRPLYACLFAGLALSPILLAAITQAYISYALPDLPWVGLEWRARGAPVYLSFALWEWTTCAVFSAYTLSLCLATAGRGRRQASIAGGSAGPAATATDSTSGAAPRSRDH